MPSGLNLAWRETGAEQTERNQEGERDEKGESTALQGRGL